MTQITLKSVEELSKALSRISGIKVFCQDNEPYNEKLSVYFTYKEGIASLKEQVKFIDWLSSLLVSEGDYTTMLSMNWWGGMNRWRERPFFIPFFIIDTYVSTIDELTHILLRRLNVRKAMCPTLGANHFPKNRKRLISIGATKTISCLKSIFASVPMSFATALAKSHRFTKNCISNLLSRMSDFHRNTISKGRKHVNHNREEPGEYLSTSPP